MQQSNDGYGLNIMLRNALLLLLLLLLQCRVLCVSLRCFQRSGILEGICVQLRTEGENELSPILLAVVSDDDQLIHWSLGGECLPLREIGEAEIFEYCVPGLGPELELFFLFFFYFWGGRWKSRGHGHGHGHGHVIWPNWGMICVL